MMMKKVFLSFVAFFMLSGFVMAQSVQDGINFLYYDRIDRAKQTLETVVSKNSKDPYAIYWLGQALLADKDVAGAKALYQNALNSGVNDPWIWVGMGHVELLEGRNINEVKQRFEQAITASKSKKNENPDILNAIGRANADGSSKVGDPTYAIELLKRAGNIDKANSDIYYNMGVNYLKLGSMHGGDAVDAFNEAIRRNPKDARSFFRIGRIYQSQGNVDVMNKYFSEAAGADNSYAPVYLEWFQYYANRDVNAAKEYLDKYMNIVKDDKTCETDYFYADYLFRAGKYQESLNKAKEMMNGACKDFTKLQLIYAYNYNRLGDSMKAKEAIETYFAKTAPEKILPEHYLMGSAILRKFPEKTKDAVSLLEQVFNADTITANRIKYADTIAFIYKNNGNEVERLKWLKTSFTLNPNPSNLDIYNLGDAALNGKNFALADSMFTVYKQKYPEQVYGYLGLVKSAQAKDSTGVTAIEPINDYIHYLLQDSVKNAATIGYYHAVQGGTYVNEVKDYQKALDEFELAIQFDPENAQYKSYRDQIAKVVASMNKQKSAPKKPAPKK